MASTMQRVDSPNRLGEHAVVLGAGMAGLLAARVLSEFYDSVSVVERDRLPDYPCHRRGIPQGRHVHNLCSRGLQVLGELFPGLLEDLATAGAVVVDDGDLSNFYVRVGRYELKQSGKFADPDALVFTHGEPPVSGISPASAREGPAQCDVPRRTRLSARTMRRTPQSRRRRHRRANHAALQRFSYHPERRSGGRRHGSLGAHPRFSGEARVTTGPPRSEWRRSTAIRANS